MRVRAGVGVRCWSGLVAFLVLCAPGDLRMHLIGVGVRVRVRVRVRVKVRVGVRVRVRVGVRDKA